MSSRKGRDKNRSHKFKKRDKPQDGELTRDTVSPDEHEQGEHVVEQDDDGQAAA